ncbi:MAG: hypothetical protein ACM3ZE_30845 [Myxococcales bacterium]
MDLSRRYFARQRTDLFDALQVAQSSISTVISLLVSVLHSRHATLLDRAKTEQLQRQRQDSGPNRSRHQSTNA